MVKIVLELLKMEVREDMSAAIITAIIKPLSPGRKDAQKVITVQTVCVKQKAGLKVYRDGVAHLTGAAP